MLGLSWGAGPDQVAERFAGLTPLERETHVISYRMGAVAGLLFDEGSFCPTAMAVERDDENDRIVFNFIDGGLAAIFASFGYSFEMIGLRSETLGEQAMAAFARAELQQLVLEMSGKYGAPVQITTATMRSGKLHPVGAVLFDAGTDGLIQVLFGHDGGALAGEIRYQPPFSDRNGI